MQFEPNNNMPHFTIPGNMPSLNEYLAACNKSPHIGAKMKRENTNIACICIRSELKRWKATKPLIVHFCYYQKDKRKDKDNIDSFCRKCVFDALQKCEVIKNDGWSEIENYTHDFYVAKTEKDARIEIYLEEVDITKSK